MSLPPIAAWNVRGFNNPIKVKICKDLIAVHNIKLICVLEAKISRSSVSDSWFSFSHSLFENENCCDNFGHSTPGRIWVKWDAAQMSYTPSFSSSQLIHGLVCVGSMPPFYMSVVYAANMIEERKVLWKDLLDLSSNLDMPWIVMGDFNCFRFAGEKAGGIPLNNERLGELNSFMFESGLQDLSSVGLFYTWFNQRSDSPIHIKLDRMLVNSAFLDAFPSAFYKVDSFSGSDHTPLILNAALFRKSISRFMFKDFWTKFDDFWELTQRAFERPMSASPIAHFYDCLRDLKGNIRRRSWNSSNFISNCILELKNSHAACISDLQRDPLNPIFNLNFKATCDKLALFQSAWYSWISQRAKAYWLSQGEDDLGFLYAKIKSRKNRNVIKELSSPTGLLSSHADMAVALINHFKTLFNAPTPILENSFNIPVGKMIPVHLIDSLVAQVTDAEIKGVVFAGVASSTPGPDGFFICFLSENLASFWL
ncbi:hypothetical protein KFK09_004533 [Dendrobium nobile]|uniref:Endonuclease/exonuclease/phosphatase domain-containing protein n=1 Tax=Dendrobium nobile TaxID=94219 RepID=A0A8T3C6C5_DENNO|nr:hypothetical protein KFK09_004533 [Dendrobium nobile]